MRCSGAAATSRRCASWTLDGGAGTEDQLVLLSSNGEAVMYGGTDPDSDFRFDRDFQVRRADEHEFGASTMAAICTSWSSAPAWCQCRPCCGPKAEHLGTADKNVTDMFSRTDRGKHTLQGWQVILNYQCRLGDLQYSDRGAQRLPADGPVHAGSGLVQLERPPVALLAMDRQAALSRLRRRHALRDAPNALSATTASRSSPTCS